MPFQFKEEKNVLTEDQVQFSSFLTALCSARVAGSGAAPARLLLPWAFWFPPGLKMDARQLIFFPQIF